MRQVFSVLSARSLPYAEKAIESLFQHAIEPLNLTLITDDFTDQEQIFNAVAQLNNPFNHPWRVFDKVAADERAKELFRDYPYLQAFRNGHPCWRKITDPLLFSAPDEEMIILDPDLYFPNSFTFEPTPNLQLLLMWQPPSCLFPPEIVQTAMQASIPLAHHVDIGVAQVKNKLDLAWLDWLIGQLGGQSLPRIAHVEAIVWAALAMRMGGGYLNPQHWHCWQHRQWKRLLLKCGVPGRQLLRLQNWDQMKCFHGGGIAKWWIIDAHRQGWIDRPYRLDVPSQTIPFVQLRHAQYQRNQKLKQLMRKMGYYSFLK
ncbi:hypothetical protein [Alkalinema sp. FACHB-956]|uniref:hypothetical protein n=1 Tax=Alkalinema sp. FACHB-956 TaxID=2692768 RepID=UPI0016869887|nr:hypothetical protein [Alkalinema sp. FACHB-956]MBD2328099.1 hypothetical protein [Alkalinema sp. FACHB-956]